MILCAMAVFVSIPVIAAGAQVYKWKDKDGAASYSDHPDAKKVPGAQRFKLPVSLFGFDEEPEDKGATVASNGPSDETQRQREVTKNGVEVSNFKITPSASGKATIMATLRNNMPYPAGGVRMDVILYTLDRKRLPDIEIRPTEGKIRPDWLGPGESVDISYETDISPDIISGHNVQVNWASVAPTPDKTGEGVREVVVDRKTGVAKEAPKKQPEPQNGSL
jgi:hypothetical protein